MDFMEIIERFGIACAVAVAMGFFIHRNQVFLQQPLMKELDQDFKNLTGIIIKLIDNSKRAELKLQEVVSKYNALVKIITDLMKKEKK